MTKDSGRANDKRAKHEIARDRALVAEYRLKGLSFPQIADELNNRPVTYTVSTSTVRRDYDKNIEAWNEKALAPTGAEIQEQKERLRLIEIEAWAAWSRSKDPAETMREVKKLQDIMGEEDGVKKVIDQVLVTETVEKLIKGQVGDERFLRIILDCWDKRARIDGQYTTRLQVNANIREEHEVTFKMYEGVMPSMWDDPNIEVIDGQIVRNGKPYQIVNGDPVDGTTNHDDSG